MSTAAALFVEWNAAATPPPDLTVSEWAELRRVLPETSAARGGRWSNLTAPYLTGIMDAVNEPGVKTLAVCKAHQTGGSECLHNIIGYFIEYDPCPMLFVHPTVSVAEEWSKERLADMIRSTPALRAVVRDKRQPRGSHEAESTLALKVFPGGFLALGGANTPNTFARRSVRLAIGDDVDRFPATVGDEGDPADLLINRTTSFYDALALFVSTPTLKGGRIETLYQRSDQRRYVLACPACGREDWVTWRDVTHFHVAFSERDPETARLACPCGAAVDEPGRRAMVAAGRWRPTAKAQETGLVGFHLPAMVSTLGDVTLERLAEKFLSARARGRDTLRVFVNTSLAEGWEDRTTRTEPSSLLVRRESYGDGVDLPAGAVALTAGIDVQVDRYELQVLGWGPGEERWVVDWRSIPGDPKHAATQAALLEALCHQYRHASGHDVSILATCIDSGYATEDVYAFVLQHQARQIFATKGYAGRTGEPLVGKVSAKRYGRHQRPVRVYPINVDDAKREVQSAVGVAHPGPGAMHFPLLCDEEYFAQLLAEHEEKRYNAAGVATHSVWVQDRERNEALDTAVLALAALRLRRPNLVQLAATLATAPRPMATPPVPPATATVTPRWIPPRPSGWLRRRP